MISRVLRRKNDSSFSKTTPGDEYTGESWLLRGEYTRESWLPFGQHTGEFQLPCDEYTGESTSWWFWNKHQNRFTKKNFLVTKRPGSKNSPVCSPQESFNSLIYMIPTAFCVNQFRSTPWCIPHQGASTPGDEYTGESWLHRGEYTGKSWLAVVNTPGSRLLIRLPPWIFEKSNKNPKVQVIWDLGSRNPATIGRKNRTCHFMAPLVLTWRKQLFVTVSCVWRGEKED